MQHLVMTTLIGFECNIFSVRVATIRMLNKTGNTVCQKYLTDITYLKRCRNGFKFKKNELHHVTVHQALCESFLPAAGLAVVQQPATANHYK